MSYKSRFTTQTLDTGEKYKLTFFQGFGKKQDNACLDFFCPRGKFTNILGRFAIMFNERKNVGT